MKPERWKQIEQLYDAALEREASQRAAFLARACADDEALRQEVALLLASDAQAGSFLAAPAVEVVARSVAAQPSPSSIGRQIGHYQVLSSLGTGGMGEVYLAQDTRLGRKIALKLLPAQFTQDADRLRRFKQEARAASALNHPNILTIYEIGEVDSTHFIATEFIDGQTLRQQTTSETLELSAALEVALQTASALAAAHAAGITHRDIKPENIMVRRDGYIKVLDFGLAKLTESPAFSLASPVDTGAPTAFKANTETGAVMGTPRYMSPEQARGEKVDARTDIFSLGVMLYEMVAGHPPFAGATPNETIAAILRDSPTPLAECAPDAPPEMGRILSKALRKDRVGRYQTAKELLLDLKDLTEERAFEARLERSLSPASARRTALALAPVAAAATASLSAPRTNESATAHTASSAEYLVREIKRHQRSIAIVLAVLIIAIAAIAYFTRGGDDSLAVLPFVNAGGDANDEILSDDISETLINSLSQLPHLKVIARSSVFRYKGREIDLQAIGHKLGVRAVVTGSLTHRGDSLHISAELVDVEGKSRIWGNQYDVKPADIFVVQEEIARQISKGLRVKITGENKQRLAKHYTENMEAFGFYVLGRHFWNKFGPENNREAIKHFKLAIAQDPGYALAYAGLAKTYGVMGLNGELPPKEVLPNYKAAAIKALEIDDQLAEAHAALAGIGLFYERDWPTAQRELRRSLDLNANDPLTHVLYSYFFTAMGRFDEAIAQVKIHQQLDPLSRPMYANMVRAYYFARRYDEAIETNRKALELDLDLHSTHLFAGVSYEQKGMNEEAISELQKAKGLLGGFPAALGALGHVYAVSGRRGEAMKTLEELKAMSKQRYVSPLDLAILYSGLGDQEQALDQLGKAYEDRSGWLINLRVEPRFDRLRSEPRFQNLLRRVGHTP